MPAKIVALRAWAMFEELIFLATGHHCGTAKVASWLHKCIYHYFGAHPRIRVHPVPVAQLRERWYLLGVSKVPKGDTTISAWMQQKGLADVVAQFADWINTLSQRFTQLEDETHVQPLEQELRDGGG